MTDRGNGIQGPQRKHTSNGCLLPAPPELKDDRHPRAELKQLSKAECSLDTDRMIVLSFPRDRRVVQADSGIAADPERGNKLLECNPDNRSDEAPICCVAVDDDDGDKTRG